MWLYTILLTCSLLVPLVLSFDKKLHFYTQWKYLFPAILIVGAFYIGFDIYLTKMGVWGFNAEYHLKAKVFGLPIEEWLFFLVIPYASIFLHDALVLYFPSFRVPDKLAMWLTIGLTAILLDLGIFFIHKTYTAYIFITGAVALGIALFDKSKIIRSYFLTYLIILLPFFAVNATLTGAFIDNEVVWYNDQENLGVRVLTIPVEDFLYGFSLILLVLLTRERLRKFY